MKLHRIASCLLLTGYLLLPATPLSAQSAAEDSALYKKSVAHLINLYHASAGLQSGLFNGSQYAGYPFFFTEGHPFFKDSKPNKGAVLYDGILYENVSMQFDEVQEVVFMQDSVRRIQLLTERVARFSLLDNNFIRIVRDTTTTVLVGTGFYNVLHDGNVSLLKKEEKRVREDVSTGEIRRFIDVSEYYYLRKSGVYYNIKSKNSLLNLFKDKKREIRKFIAGNNLSYRKDRENTLTKTTAYYDQLTK